MATEIKQPAPVPDKVLPRPWQFSLRELMLWMLALSVYFGATAALGPLVGVLGGVVLAGCVLAHFHRRMPHRMSPLEWIVVGLILLALLFFLLWPAVSTPRYAIRRMSCGNTLKQIGLALHNYHDTYNCFPPAYVADSTGQPLHSWRVLILPFMEQQALYARYRFDEPWDGPNNRQLHREIVAVYHCPGDDKSPRLEANYLVVVGPGTVFPGENCTSMNQISDGTSNTLLVVEVHNSGIHWLEPRDLHVTQMATTINPQAGQGISSLHRNGAHSVYVDCHVEFIPSGASPAQIRARMTIAGGEKIEEF